MEWARQTDETTKSICFEIKSGTTTTTLNWSQSPGRCPAKRKAEMLWTRQGSANGNQSTVSPGQLVGPQEGQGEGGWNAEVVTAIRTNQSEMKAIR